MEAARLQEAQAAGASGAAANMGTESNSARTGPAVLSETGAPHVGGSSSGNPNGPDDAASNFMWPTGFTPENQPFSLTMPDQTEPTMAQFMQGFGPFGTDPAVNNGSQGGEGSGSHSAYLPSRPDPDLAAAFATVGSGFGFNTSPGTDMRLFSALENQAAYIEGNPAEDRDLELYYYRFVSVVDASVMRRWR